MSTPAAARLKELEAKLQRMHERGGERNEYVGGYGGGHLHASSFSEVERHERERKELVAQVKEARAAAKAEKDGIKTHAASSSDPSAWTSRLLQGDDSHFDKADDGIERELAQATYGLVSHSAFVETKERLEKRRASQADSAPEAAAEAERKRQRKRQKLRQQQAAKLSFDDLEGESELGGHEDNT